MCLEHVVVLRVFNGHAATTAQTAFRVCAVPHHSSTASSDTQPEASSNINSDKEQSSTTQRGSSTDGFEVVVIVGEGVAADNVTKDSVIADLVDAVGEDVRDRIVDVIVEVSDGKVTSVVVIVSDKDTALAVVGKVNGLDKGDECTAGVLCRATDVFIDSEQPKFSAAHRTAQPPTTAKTATIVVLAVVVGAICG